MERLLAFARGLQNAATFVELLEVTHHEVLDATGYQHIWFYVLDYEKSNELRLLELASERDVQIRSTAGVLRIDEDPLIQEILSSDVPVVVPDARCDPRTDKKIVERLGNRTLINMPLRLVDQPIGVLGIGTFGDEGVRPPSDEQMQFLVAMASQIVVAAGRIRFLELRDRAEKDRQQLERRLTQAQKLESLGMLAGGVAHDFNNLLTVVTMSASLALDRATDVQQRSDILAVLGAAQRGEELTRQLLAMSRAQDLELQTLDVNVQARHLVELARRVVPETIEIELIEGAQLPLIEADASQIDQVLMNLIINARDAMPNGGKLTMETQPMFVNGRYAATHPWARPGLYVLITVTDTGIGMPREVQDRVFEPFFTTKGPRVGSGLGLAVVYGIVRQHRGMVHCYSEEGLGTSFKIYLPALEQAAQSLVHKPQPQVSGGAEHILVAEDDEHVRSVVVKILERAGYKVQSVEDGEVACRILSETHVDLVLIDVAMPGLACREVVSRIHSLRPDTPIVLTSGYPAGSNMSALVTQTGFELLTKPYDPDRILKVVRGALDARK